MNRQEDKADTTPLVVRRDALIDSHNWWLELCFKMIWGQTLALQLAAVARLILLEQSWPDIVFTWGMLLYCLVMQGATTAVRFHEGTRQWIRNKFKKKSI